VKQRKNTDRVKIAQYSHNLRTASHLRRVPSNVIFRNFVHNVYLVSAADIMQFSASKNKCQCISHTHNSNTSASILLCSGNDIVSDIVADDFGFFLSDLRGLPLFLAEKQTEAVLPVHSRYTYIGHFTVWISPLIQWNCYVYTQASRSIFIIMGIYMSSSIYYYYTKEERNDVDEKPCRCLTARVSRKCLG